MRDEVTNEYARLYNPFMVTVSKSPVMINYPYFFSGVRPFISVLRYSNNYSLDDLEPIKVGISNFFNEFKVNLLITEIMFSGHIRTNNSLSSSQAQKTFETYFLFSIV